MITLADFQVREYAEEILQTFYAMQEHLPDQLESLGCTGDFSKFIEECAVQYVANHLRKGFPDEVNETINKNIRLHLRIRGGA